MRCTVVGGGPLELELRSRISDAGLARIVELTGPLRQEEVRSALRRATLFVLPCVVARNADRDGIPNALMEAMAMEIPVVSTAVAGVPELVHDGSDGLLVPPADAQALADAMRTLIESPPLRDRLGRAGRRTVEADFEVRDSARRLERLFRSETRAGAS